jgi:predicted DNA-binding protein YlxM (UPF0122 family)
MPTFKEYLQQLKENNSAYDRNSIGQNIDTSVKELTSSEEEEEAYKKNKKKKDIKDDNEPMYGRYPDPDIEYPKLPDVKSTILKRLRDEGKELHM